VSHSSRLSSNIDLGVGTVWTLHQSFTRSARSNKVGIEGETALEKPAPRIKMSLIVPSSTCTLSTLLQRSVGTHFVDIFSRTEKRGDGVTFVVRVNPRSTASSIVNRGKSIM